MDRWIACIHRQNLPPLSNTSINEGDGCLKPFRLVFVSFLSAVIEASMCHTVATYLVT